MTEASPSPMQDRKALKNAVHREPVWRDRADYIVVAELPEEGRGEQLWARQVAEHQFEMCCIPFFLYGVALGDLFDTDANDRFQAVIKRSGRHVWRVWFGDTGTVPHAIADQLSNLGALLEWSSKDLLAVDAPNAERARVIDDFLVARHEAGELIMERAATRIDGSDPGS